MWSFFSAPKLLAVPLTFFPKVDYNQKARHRHHDPSLAPGGIVAVVSPLPVLKETPTPTSSIFDAAAADCGMAKPGAAAPASSLITFACETAAAKQRAVQDDPTLFYNVRTNL